jgi:hypothetical protein
VQVQGYAIQIEVIGKFPRATPAFLSAFGYPIQLLQFIADPL